MLNKHAEYIKKTLKNRDDLFYLTQQDRISTLFWALNALKILKDPYFEDLKESSLKFVISCLREDNGFSPNPSYPSTMTSTFSALQILYILDIPYYNDKTVKFILKLQNEKGEFCFDSFGDFDTRLDCCAICSLKILSIMKKYKTPDFNCYTDDFFDKNSVKFDRDELKQPIDKDFLNEIGFNINLTMQHLTSCQNVDGGFGQIKGSESHGAQIFCVVASLKVLGYLEYIDKNKTVEFLVYRQLNNGGLAGRINKKEDVCYSFWVYSALHILDASNLIDNQKLKEFIYKCEDQDGGFSDRPGNEPDLYHLMFSLSSLSLLGESGFNEVDPCFSF